MDRSYKVLKCGSSKVGVTAQTLSSVFSVPLCETIRENNRSEVTSANRYWGSDTSNTNTPVLGQQYSYEYDSIGNRISTSTPNSSLLTSNSVYVANELNQYTSRTVPPTASIIGSAPDTVDVYANGVSVDRQGPYWHSVVTVNNVPSPIYAEIEILGVLEPVNQNDPPEYSISTNHLFVAKSPEVFEYDLDGNLTKDGRFTYTWNGENRLICAETRDDLPIEVPRHRVEYAYDYMGRMISKEVSDVSKNCKLKTINFLWDNWNIISETTVSSIPNSSLLTTNSTSYVWGIDLSGTLQGAGGVGGLLAVIRDDGVFAPTYDGNGNVSEYIVLETGNSQLETGSVVAHYEYSPFGEIIVQSGDLADSFSFRFSTKPYCSILDKIEFELRIYDPVTGSWMSSDPIWENGGINLYGVAGNSPVNRIDKLGLEACCCEDQINEELRAVYRTATLMTEIANIVLMYKEPPELGGRKRSRSLGLEYGGYICCNKKGDVKSTGPAPGALRNKDYEQYGTPEYIKWEDLMKLNRTLQDAAFVQALTETTGNLLSGVKEDMDGVDCQTQHGKDFFPVRFYHTHPNNVPNAGRLSDADIGWSNFTRIPIVVMPGTKKPENFEMEINSFPPDKPNGPGIRQRIPYKLPPQPQEPPPL